MNRSTTRSARRRALAALPAALALLLAACSGGGGGGGEAANCNRLLFWSWVPQLEQTVQLYEQAHPGVDVELVNVGQGEDHYTQLRTTMSGGTGVPDVVQMEYKNIPGFVLTDSLVDLTQYGVADLQDRFLPSAWAQVNVVGGVWGVPQDTGPMIMLYRSDIFESLGIPVPTTWAEYAEAGRRIRAADPNRYLTFFDPGEAGQFTSLLWQAGGRPFVLEGESNLTINMTDEGAQRWAQTFTPLMTEGLVEVTPGFSDEWYRALADGRYATWVVGAWGPTFLQSAIPQTAGMWRAAPMPQQAGENAVTAEHGGSSVSVTAQSDCPREAADFAIWLNSDPAAARSLNEVSLLFPATRELAESQEFLSAPSPFLGGQQANQVYVEASSHVGSGWQYTPFQDYAENAFDDTVGLAISNRSDLYAGLQAWGQQLRTYATEQGFTVSGG